MSGRCTKTVISSHAILTSNTSNERFYCSVYTDINKTSMNLRICDYFSNFSNFIFLNRNFSLRISFTRSKLSRYFRNILMEGIVSQISDSCLSFILFEKTGFLFVNFALYFSRLHKTQTKK